MQNANKSWACAMIIRGPGDRIPLVIDYRKDDPRWKFPGGKSEPGETIEQTAIREIEEEVGLTILKPIKLLEQDRGSHMFYLFGAEVSTFDRLLDYGDEGEKVETFTMEEIAKMPDFFPSHRRLLEQLTLLKAA